MYAIGETPLVGTTWVLVLSRQPGPAHRGRAGDIDHCHVLRGRQPDRQRRVQHLRRRFYRPGWQPGDQCQPTTLMACTMAWSRKRLPGSPAQGESYAITGPVLQITYDGGAGCSPTPRWRCRWSTPCGLWQPSRRTGTEVPLTMQFIPGDDPSTGTVGGLVVCNNYNAGYTLDGSNLTISPTLTTLMACPPGDRPQPSRRT